MPALYQLHQLLTVSERGTLSAAAEELHISRPALTRSMQKLEEEFGVPLFDRSKRQQFQGFAAGNETELFI